MCEYIDTVLKKKRNQILKIKFLYLQVSTQFKTKTVKWGGGEPLVSSQSVSLYVALLFTEKTVPQTCQLWNF